MLMKHLDIARTQRGDRQDWLKGRSREAASCRPAVCLTVVDTDTAVRDRLGAASADRLDWLRHSPH